MFDAVHALASAYGWTKTEILETVYPDEIDYYVKRIRRDKINERLATLAIVHNPHAKDPKKLIRELQQEAKDTNGTKYYEKQRMDDEDIRQLMELKRRMMENAQKRRGG